MFAELCDHLYRFHTERKAALKDRDEKREQDPEWFKKTDMLGMMPFLDTPKGRSDGGYAVADFRKIRPDLGTMADLAKLADLCHEKGMDVIRIDAVPYIWKELGTNCRNLPQVHTIVRMICMIPYCRPVGFTGQSERVGKKSRCRNCSILCW